MILKQMKESLGCKVKDIVEPKSYLGADIGQQTGIFGRYMVHFSNYICKQGSNICRGKSWISENILLEHKQYPATIFHPELFNTTFLGTDTTNLYQSYVGIFRRVV